MTNSNCLANIKCPHCGNEEHFNISARVLAYATDEGAEAAVNSSIDWDNDSPIDCPECNHSGTVGSFAVTQAREE